jgi:hypothetical protein
MKVKTQDLIGAQLDYAVARVIALGTDQMLIAALRCFVASRLGDEVDIPEELCK